MNTGSVFLLLLLVGLVALIVIAGVGMLLEPDYREYAAPTPTVTGKGMVIRVSRDAIELMTLPATIHCEDCTVEVQHNGAAIRYSGELTVTITQAMED